MSLWKKLHFFVFQRSPKDVQLHKVKPNHDAPRWVRSHRYESARVGNLWGTARGAVLLAPPWVGLKPPALSWDYASVFTNAQKMGFATGKCPLKKKKSPNFPHWVWIKNHRIFTKIEHPCWAEYSCPWSLGFTFTEWIVQFSCLKFKSIRFVSGKPERYTLEVQDQTKNGF